MIKFSASRTRRRLASRVLAVTSGVVVAAVVATSISADATAATSVQALSRSFDVSIHASAETSSETALPADTVYFRVSTTNTGTSPYTDTDPASYSIDLSDVLDDATYNNDAFSPGGTVSYSNSIITWSGLPGGFLGSLQFTAQVQDPTGVDYVPGNQVLYAAVITPTGGGGDCPAGSMRSTCSTAVPEAEYSMVKTASVATTAQGRKVTYAVTLTNIGKADLTPSIPASFSDDLTGVLDDATYDNDASGGATYSAPTVSWSGRLDIGTSITITYSVTVKAPDTGDLDLIDEGSTPFGGSCLGGFEAQCSTSTPVLNPPPGGPSAPGLPIVRTPSIFSSGLQLKWGAAPSNGSPVTSYTVTAAPAQGTPIVATVSANDRAYTFSNLTPGMSYRLSVRGGNAVGTGPSNYTDAIVGTPGMPTAAGVVNYPGAIQLKWGYGASRGSPITSYILTCYTVSTGACGLNFTSQDPQSFTTETPATARAYTFGYLPGHGTYTFYIWAENKNGGSVAPLTVVVTQWIAPNNSRRRRTQPSDRDDVPTGVARSGTDPRRPSR